jgi:predicted MFS family arabinose efflux permease
MVAPHLLMNAVTLNHVVLDSGKATGPAIAALLIAGVGLPYAFIINALTFVAAFLGLFLMNPAELDVPTPVRRNPGQLRAGFAYVRQTPHLFGPLLLLTCVGLFAFNLQVLLPLLGKDTFDGDARTVGYLVAALGIGAVLGGLSLAGLLKPNPTRVVGSALIMAALYLAVAASSVLGVTYALVFLMGISNVVYKAITSTWLQMTAEPMMRGRVLSLLVLSTAGTSPVGAPLVGWLANTYGTRASFLVAGVATAIAGVFTYVYLQRVAARHAPKALESSPAG